MIVRRLCIVREARGMYMGNPHVFFPQFFCEPKTASKSKSLSVNEVQKEGEAEREEWKEGKKGGMERERKKGRGQSTTKQKEKEKTVLGHRKVMKISTKLHFEKYSGDLRVIHFIYK